MKILYAIQGTGNGHITCALDLLPRLMKKADVDVLISGCQVDIDLPYEVRYRLNGLSFIFGKNGGIDYLKTFKKSNLKKLYREITALPVEEYDLVLSDFEPVSAWACKLKGKPCIGLSHQSAVLGKDAPRPKRTDIIGKAVLRYYAPSSESLGYHYKKYNRQTFTPLIRSEIRKLKPENNGHYVVYLPAYSDKKIIRMLSRFPDINWKVFSKHCQQFYIFDNVEVIPVKNQEFISALETATGVLCGAGFQTPAEVLFLKKKLMVIPMKGQYEQQCNAAALKEMNIPVIKNLKKKRYDSIKKWLEEPQEIEVDFPDNSSSIIRKIMNLAEVKGLEVKTKSIFTFPEFKQYFLRKLIPKA